MTPENKAPDLVCGEEGATEVLLSDSTHKDTQNLPQIKIGNKIPISVTADANVFSSNVINLSEEQEEDEALIMQGDRPLVSRKNMATGIGKAKAFKSFFMSGLVATIEDDCLGFSACPGLKKALYTDTEQGRFHVAKVLKRIHRLCGWECNKNSDKVVMLAMREHAPSDRLERIVNAIAYYRPDLVVIDGIRDLLQDFNNIEESNEVVTVLMQVSSIYNCGIITVLHQNKADNNARGHLGTELMNKSETVLQIANEGGIACVTPLFSRNREIEPFSFRIDSEGLPTLCEPPKVIKKNTELETMMAKAMFGSAWIERKTLIDKLVTLTGKTKRTAERKVSDAMEADVLRINKQGYIILARNDPEYVPLPF